MCESSRRLWSVLVRNVKIRQTDVVKYWQRRSRWMLCRSGAMELVKCAPNRPSSEFKQWIFDQFYNPDAPRLPGIASDPGFVFIVTNDNLERVNECKMCTVRGQDIGSVVDYLERMNVVFVSEHFQALRIVHCWQTDRNCWELKRIVCRIMSGLCLNAEKGRFLKPDADLFCNLAQLYESVREYALV